MNTRKIPRTNSAPEISNRKSWWMSARSPRNPFRYRFTFACEDAAVKKLYPAPPYRPRDANPPGFPRAVRVQLAGPPGLLRRPREAPEGGRGEGPRGDPRLDEERVLPHPHGPRRLAQRDGAGRVRGPRLPRARRRRRHQDRRGAPAVPGEDHREGGDLPRLPRGEGPRAARAARVEGASPPAPGRAGAGHARAGPPRRGADRDVLAAGRRAAGDDVDRRPPPDPGRHGAVVVASSEALICRPRSPAAMAAFRTPLYAWHVSHGARIVEFAGWDMPLLYPGIVDEHLAVRRAAGLFDVSHMGKLLLEGPGTSDAVDRLSTNDIPGTSGRARYTHL